MTFTEFQSASARTYKPGRPAGHALGIAGEAGEVADIVKKTLYHDEPEPLITHPRREALREELGDVLFYVMAVASDWGLSLNDVAQGNMDKLKARYPDGFVKGGGIREPQHVCGLQGFGALGDVCPACDARFNAYRDQMNPMSEKD